MSVRNHRYCILNQVCYLRVCEQEDSVLVLYAGHIIEFLEVIVKCRIVVSTTQFNLETLVAADVRSQPTETMMFDCIRNQRNESMTQVLLDLCLYSFQTDIIIQKFCYIHM